MFLVLSAFHILLRFINFGPEGSASLSFLLQLHYLATFATVSEHSKLQVENSQNLGEIYEELVSIVIS